MKLWHKLRRGAFFVDILLILIALIAIVGLAAFVHVHGTKSPYQANKQSTLAFNTSYIDDLNFDSTGSASTGSSPAPSPSPSTSANTSSGLQDTMPAPEAEVALPLTCKSEECLPTIKPVETPPVTLPIVVPILKDPITLPPLPIKPCPDMRLNLPNTSEYQHIACPLY